MAVEIVRNLCGSIGLVTAMPITTVLAAVLVGTDRRPVDDSQEPPTHSEAEHLRRPSWDDFGPIDDDH